MKLPEHLRSRLKVPLGKLIPNDKVTRETILENLSEDSYLITVGDATTEKMMSFGIIPSLQIVDNLEKRSSRNSPIPDEGIKTKLSCINPAAEISQESIDVIKQALESEEGPVRITVKGEEDLLVIPVCIYAPENSVVMYGQPHEGLVITKVDSEIRNKTKSILNSME
ncbi:MAG: DUF359 domain-containing protein [Candidatus Korarchaeota archaeon]|nr:DUF359 domain-containing protein [Candidatus Korarchaeota archaeon]